MKAILLTTLVGLSVLVSSAQKSEVLSEKVNKNIKDTCCCKAEPSCIINGIEIKTKDIVVDFRSKNIANPDEWYKIKKGNYIRLKISNYNPLLYKVIIDSKDSSVAAPVDAKILTSFFDPTGLSSIVAGLIEKAGTAPIGVPAQTTKDLIKGFTPQLYMHLDGTEPEDPLKAIYNINCPKKDLLDKKGKWVLDKNKQPIKFQDTLKCLDELYAKHTSLIQTDNENLKKKKDELEEALYKILRNNSVTQTLYPDCNTFKNAFNNTTAEGIKNTMKKFRDELESMQAYLKKEFEVYAVVTAPYRSFITKTPSLAIKDSIVKKFYSDAFAAINKFTESISYMKVAEMIAKLETILLHSSCYISFPIFMGDDVKKINIDFKPRYDSLGLPPHGTTLVLPPVQWKIWGVSGGIFATGLHNEGYNVKTLTQTNSTGGTDTLYNIVKDGSGNAQIGGNALAYVGWKLKKNDTPDYLGFCFGAGLSIESKPKPRALIGLSFITGDKNRIVISAGLIGGNVKVLSNAFDPKFNYTQSPTDFLKDKMKLNGFLSINYSFLSK